MSMTNYIALDDLDYFWTERQVQKMIVMYNKKMHISDIAKRIRRPQVECALLIIDLGRRGII